MAYLRLLQTRIILAAFLGTSLLLVALPDIDLGFSRLFFDHGFPLAEKPWNRWLHAGLGIGVASVMAGAAALYAWNRLTRQRVLGIDGRSVCYLALVLAIGAGLIVNVLFKDHFGRARPRDIREFGGNSEFTRAFVISRECSRNCSFSSGEGAGAFLSLAVARLLSRRRRVMLAAVALGGLVSLGRIAAGAHFLSDVVVSFFAMLIVSDLLHHLMSLWLPGAGAESPGDLPEPAIATAANPP